MIKLGIPLDSLSLPYIKEEDRFKHSVIIGETGSGKTTFLLNLIKEENEHAQIILDPGGDLADKASRLDIDPYRLLVIDKRHPISLNPLNTALPRSEQANELIEVIKNVVEIVNPMQPGITVLMEMIIRQAVRVLKKPDVEYLGHFLEYDTERRQLTADPYWCRFDEKAGSFYVNREAVESAKRINARLSALYLDDNAKQFIKGKNQFNIPDIVNNKKIVIFNLTGFDDEITSYIGVLITSQLKNYYLRAGENAQPLYFYCDEFHLFFTGHIDRFLMEARKKQLSVNLATHRIGKAGKQLASDLMTHCFLKVILGSNAEDAKIISDNLSIPPQDIIQLKKNQAIIGLGKIGYKCLCYPPPKFKEPVIFNFQREGWFSA